MKRFKGLKNMWNKTPFYFAIALSLGFQPLLFGDATKKNETIMGVDLNKSKLEDLEKEHIYPTQQIESLANLKDYYLAKAARFRNRANRYQFQTGGANYPEAKKLWKEADEYDNIVHRINEELVQLERQKSSVEKKMAAASQL